MAACGTPKPMRDDRGREHRTLFEPEHGESVVSSVVVSVAAVSGAEPTALPPLHGTLDTDALEALVGSAREADTPLTVTFGYAGYLVSVDADGSIRIGETVPGN